MSGGLRVSVCESGAVNWAVRVGCECCWRLMEPMRIGERDFCIRMESPMNYETNIRGLSRGSCWLDSVMVGSLLRELWVGDFREQ